MKRAIAAAALILAMGATTAAAQCPQTTLADIEDEVLCPQCGVPLALATDAPQAQAQREFMTRLIDEECASKQQVKDALVAQFGEQVLAEPGDDGFDLAAWIVPVALLLAAAGGSAVALGRWRRRTRTVEAIGPQPEDPDAERLRADMERYDL